MLIPTAQLWQRSCIDIFLFQSERHLDKITMVDEFLKRIFTVLHSNDPVARALTLRTLGAISVIIPERKQVLKSITHNDPFTIFDFHQIDI